MLLISNMLYHVRVFLLNCIWGQSMCVRVQCNALMYHLYSFHTEYQHKYKSEKSKSVHLKIVVIKHVIYKTDSCKIIPIFWISAEEFLLFFLLVVV